MARREGRAQEQDHRELGCGCACYGDLALDVSSLGACRMCRACEGEGGHGQCIIISLCRQGTQRWLQHHHALPHHHPYTSAHNTTTGRAAMEDAAAETIKVVAVPNLPDGFEALWLVGFAVCAALVTEGEYKVNENEAGRSPGTHRHRRRRGKRQERRQWLTLCS